MISATPGEFRCPVCFGNLFQHTEFLICKSCSRSYPCRDGIYSFLSEQSIKNADNFELVSELPSGLTERNWAKTIRQYVKQSNNRYANPTELTSAGNSAWKLLLDLSQDTVLLDLGCGSGTTTENLSRLVSKTFAVDPSSQALNFAKARLSIFNSDCDIVLVESDAANQLPFPDKMFDCIVLSDIERFVRPLADSSNASRRQSGRPYKPGSATAVQEGYRKILAELARILKPNGILFLIALNRLAYHNLFGSSSTLGSRLSALAPRRALELAGASNVKPATRYSIFGYRRLLRRAGFASSDFFALEQSAVFLKHILALDHAIDAFEQEPVKSVRKRIKRNKLLVKNYGIAAYKGRRPKTSLLERLIHQVERNLSQSLDGRKLTITDFGLSRKEKVILKGRFGDLPTIIRVPLNRPALGSEQRNAAMLANLESRKDLVSILPRALISGQLCKLHYFVESWVPGSPLRQVIAENGPSAMLSDVSELLDLLNPRVILTELGSDGDPIYDIEVTERLRKLLDFIHDAGERLALERYFSERVRGLRVPVGIVHGDFSLSNILIFQGAISGVIDWESGSTTNSPIFDAINYLTSVTRLLSGEKAGTSILRVAAHQYGSAELAHFIARRYEIWNVNQESHQALVFVKWLHHISYLLDYWLQYDEQEMLAYVSPVVKAISDQMAQLPRAKSS